MSQFSVLKSIFYVFKKLNLATQTKQNAIYLQFNSLIGVTNTEITGSFQSENETFCRW